MFKNKNGNNKNNLCGEKVRVLRTEAGMSQRMLAEAMQLIGIDLDKNTIQRIECGKRFVTDIELKALSKVLNVTLEELLDE